MKETDQSPVCAYPDYTLILSDSAGVDETGRRDIAAGGQSRGGPAPHSHTGRQPYWAEDQQDQRRAINRADIADRGRRALIPLPGLTVPVIPDGRDEQDAHITSVTEQLPSSLMAKRSRVPGGQGRYRLKTRGVHTPINRPDVTVGVCIMYLRVSYDSPFINHFMIATRSVSLLIITYAT